MHLLLTNDDGIHAPGLLALENAALAMGATCTVVAPAVEQSQCGHRVTTHTPLKVTEISKGHYAVHGTPADCVRIALFGLSLEPD
ncbi:MAG: surE 1, partial [Verrucomicrobiaceae bacterium]|nr:surE 1 [Verrucomicrobiaceae bacterium]